MPNESKTKDKSDAPFKGACYVGHPQKQVPQKLILQISIPLRYQGKPFLSKLEDLTLL